MILNYLKIVLRFVVAFGVFLGLVIVGFAGFQLDWKIATVGAFVYAFSLIMLT